MEIVSYNCVIITLSFFRQYGSFYEQKNRFWMYFSRVSSIDHKRQSAISSRGNNPQFKNTTWRRRECSVTAKTSQSVWGSSVSTSAQHGDKLHEWYTTRRWTSRMIHNTEMNFTNDAQHGDKLHEWCTKKTSSGQSGECVWIFHSPQFEAFHERTDALHPHYVYAEATFAMNYKRRPFWLQNDTIEWFDKGETKHVVRDLVPEIEVQFHPTMNAFE